MAAPLDPDVALEVDGLSKRYPGVPVRLYPPMVSMFDRRPFRRKGRPPPAGGAAGADLADDELDDEDDEDELDDAVAPAPARPGPYWAVRDLSFELRAGEAMGVLGGAGAGKSTLLRILGGFATPTEGTVRVREPVSPPTTVLNRALGFMNRGMFDFNLVLGCRMVGIDAGLAARHKDEIMELASPELGPDGRYEPKGIIKLAVATAVVLPWSVMLIDLGRGIDDGFQTKVVRRLRKRLDEGGALVLASREPGVVAQTCTETIWLDEGKVVERAGAKRLARRYESEHGETGGVRQSGGKAWERLPTSRDLLQGERLRVPDNIPPFNESAALQSAAILSGGGRLKRLDATGEVALEVRLETAVPDVDAQVGFSLRARAAGTPNLRVELPAPIRFSDAAAYLLVARVPPGMLPGGTYQVRADAVVSSPNEAGAGVIQRDVGRVRIVGADGAELPEPVANWYGGTSARVDADWSIE